jgi:tyrosine-protein phosphatase SIW14
MKRQRGWLLTLLIGVLACSLGGQEPATSAPARPAPAEKSKVGGIPNFGKLNPRLHRGGQPTAEGFRKLKEMGIELVVNFREDSKDISRERQQVEGLGMRFVSIPWNAWDEPDDRHVAEFLTLLRANPERKVFVHCKHGKERTGLMVAAYRMTFEHWTPEQALAEMESFGIRGFWFRHLKKYARTFPDRLQSDPDFATLRPEPAR